MSAERLRIVMEAQYGSRFHVNAFLYNAFIEIAIQNKRTTGK